MSYTSHPQEYNQPNGKELLPERQAELRSAYESNISNGKEPYAEVEIRSRCEVSWIMQEREWSANGWPNMPANFAGARFSGQQFRGVVLAEADLSGAICVGANFEDAILYQATLHDANLAGANLTGAMLEGASLESASLFQTDLSGATLSEADLRGANLSFAILSVKTDLTAVRLDETTKIADVVWNGAPLALVDWDKCSRFGDETEFGGEVLSYGTMPWEKAKSSTGAEILNYTQAARAYRGLAMALHSQGLLETAAKFRMQEQAMLRKLTFVQHKYGAWFFSGLLNFTAGYGELPFRTVLVYLILIGGFADIYYALGQIAGPRLPLLGALVFSITSFHGRGFFPGSIPSLTDPLVIVAALEAIIGLFIELIFIATFSRRFLGS